MNKGRRAELAEIIEAVQAFASEVESLKDRIESIRDEEQEYYDNMPESFQQADRGYAAEAAVGEMDNAISMLEDFGLDDIVSSLETAGE